MVSGEDIGLPFLWLKYIEAPFLAFSQGIPNPFFSLRFQRCKSLKYACLLVSISKKKSSDETNREAEERKGIKVEKTFTLIP